MKKQPRCLGNFDKCPLTKKLVCYRRYGDEIIDKCKTIAISKKEREMFGMYKDEEGNIWVKNE